MTVHYVGGWAVDSTEGPLMLPLGASAVPAGSFFLNGAAYSSIGQRYCTFDTIASGDVYLGGLRHRQDGAVRVTNTLPSVKYPAAFGMVANSDGQLYVNPDSTLAFFQNGFPFASDGGLVSRTGDSSLIWEFDASTLSVTPSIGTGTPTVTRAGNTATAVNSVGNIAIVNANLPRFDYNPVTLALRGLLVEEGRTNTFLQASAFGTASWTKDNVTISSDSQGAPDGTNGADKFVESTNNTTHSAFQTIAFTAAAWTVSIYVKAAERTWFSIRENSTGAVRRTWFNLSTGAVGTINAGHTATITAAGSNWYRCTITFTGTAVAQFVEFAMATGDGNIAYVGDGVSGLYVWGAQAELGGFVTSFIPTTTGTVARAADVTAAACAGITGLSASLHTQWVEVISGIELSDTGTSRVPVSIGTDANNVIALRENPASDTVFAQVRQAANNHDTGSIATTVGTNRYATAIEAAANGAIAACNGTLSTASTPGAMPVFTTLWLGTLVGGSSGFGGHIKKVRLYNVRKANAVLQAITV